MTRMIHKATFFVACILLAGVTIAAAGVPSPGNSVIGGGTNHERINISAFIGSTKADSLAPGSTLNVLVRDLANNVIGGSNVILDFQSAYTDFEINGTQNFRGETASCTAGSVHQVANFTTAAGTVLFAVTGGGLPVGAIHAAQLGKVYADGVLLGTFGIGSYDRNGSLGADVGDLGSFANDYFLNPTADRSNYNGLAGVDVSDLGNFASYYFGPAHTSAGALCTP